MSLAAWIGGYVLFLLVRPLSNRAMAANQTPIRVALGGWLAPAVMGAVQVLFLVALLGFGLRIVPSHLVLTPLFLVLVSVTFVAIVQALNAWLGTAGQFLALVLMLVQLVSAGGTFPWQTIPTPLWGLHRVLPMSYSVDGLRHLLYGGDLAPSAGRAVLLGYLVGAVILSRWRRGGCGLERQADQARAGALIRRPGPVVVTPPVQQVGGVAEHLVDGDVRDERVVVRAPLVPSSPGGPRTRGTCSGTTRRPGGGPGAVVPR